MSTSSQVSQECPLASQRGPVSIERRVRSILSKLSPDNLMRISQQVADIELDRNDIQTVARLTVCKALSEPKFSKCYAHLIQEWHWHRLAAAQHSGMPCLDLRKAVISSFRNEFDDLMLSLMGEECPLPTPFAPDPPRAQGYHRPEGLTFENDMWRQVQQRRFFLATGEFVSTLFLLGLAPASCIDNCVQSLIKQQLRACARQAVPARPLQAENAASVEADSAKNAELPQLMLLSGGKAPCQPRVDDTVRSLQTRLARDLGVSEDRIRLICPSGALLGDADLVLDLKLKEQELQVVVLPDSPKELLVECLCGLANGLVEATAMADPTEARFAPLTSPLVVPAPVVNPATKKAVDEQESSTVRNELLEECASHLGWAKDASNSDGKPALSRRVFFLIEDTLKRIQHWQTHSIKAGAST
eukprot:TRINITY_DN8041_c0_g1_i1.p1 TRINITY_DN8041_c0_g1~~TRINITY_DN8041_c0_g1_i1.p1  ORF type:complete len:417 (+),score=76.83 TRINITY_DN8041_c0_g1_i1:148-1398(+)